MADIVQDAKQYLHSNAAESGADTLIKLLIEEVDRPREVLCDANNRWRHDFTKEVEDATEKLFKKLAAHRTDPFGRKQPPKALAEEIFDRQNALRSW